MRRIIQINHGIKASSGHQIKKTISPQKVEATSGIGQDNCRPLFILLLFGCPIVT